MMLYAFEDERDDIVRVAAKMVEVSMSSRSSVCSVVKGIPLVTYPNDCRTPRERIENLVLAFTDGWMRSQMANDCIQAIDTRFDPRFECQDCKAAECREEMLYDALSALTTALGKSPNSRDIAFRTSAAAMILQTVKEQRAQAEQIKKALKP